MIFVCYYWLVDKTNTLGRIVYFSPKLESDDYISRIVLDCKNIFVILKIGNIRGV